ncbi:transposase-like protein [Ochrobactrum sp. P20RRXII]|nr:transposase-like protein [Ochrobactrum sp. P20RRXII]
MAGEIEAEHPSRWAAVSSIAAKISCPTYTLNEWVKKVEVHRGKRAGLPSDVADRMKEPERESRELRRANEILREVSAYIAEAELGRPLKRCSLSSMNIERCLIPFKYPFAENPRYYLIRRMCI